MSAVSPAMIELPVGGTMPQGVEASPATEFVRTYGKSVFGVPGMFSLKWSAASDADTVTLVFKDRRTTAMGSAIVENAINGVKLLKETRNPDTPPAGEIEGSEVIRGVASMKGVWDYEFRDTPPWVDGHVTFKTINSETTNLLDPIVRNSLPGFTRKDGSQLRFNVHWRAGIPQPRTEASSQNQPTPTEPTR